MGKIRERVSTGLSVKTIMDMPISKLQEYTTTQQREIISRLGSAANKRLKKLENAGIENSATIRIDKSGGKISVRGKSSDDLIKEYIRARDFLQNKFSSVREWNKVIKNISEKSEINMDKSSVSQAFSYYDLLREMDKEIVKQINKYELMTVISTTIEKGKSRNDVINKSIEYINEQTKKNMQDYEESSSRFGDSIEYDIPKRVKSKRKR